MPPRVLPSPPADPEPTRRPDPPGGGSAGAAAGSDVAGLLAVGASAYRRETLQERLDLDDGEFTGLVSEGWLSEVRIGGLRRYSITEAASVWDPTAAGRTAP